MYIADMAGKIVDMSKIKQVIRLHDEGKSKVKEPINEHIMTVFCAVS
jgi:hypothetical protein